MLFYYIHTTMHKVQLTLTPEEAQILSVKAAPLGYSITKFLKLLIGREVLSHIEEEFPTYKMTPRMERKVHKAWQEHKDGKTKRISSFQELRAS